MSNTNITVNSEEGWLSCRIDPGMFSDERAVTYPAVGERQKSVFVTSASVSGKPGEEGKVRVRVVRRGNTLLAVLPSPNQDMVTINESDLSP